MGPCSARRRPPRPGNPACKPLQYGSRRCGHPAGLISSATGKRADQLDRTVRMFFSKDWSLPLKQSDQEEASRQHDRSSIANAIGSAKDELTPSAEIKINHAQRLRNSKLALS